MSGISKSDIRFEIRCRKTVVKKLDRAINELNRTVERQMADREKRTAELSEYESLEELQDAWGNDYITMEEYDRIRDQIENGAEAIAAENSVEEAAIEILKEWRKRMEREIDDFEFEALPISEQGRILKEMVNEKRGDQS